MKSVRLLPAGIVALIAVPLLTGPALADMKTGDIAWHSGDDATAINEWRPLAIAGDPDAQVRMGEAYQLGRGVPVDLKLAEDWFRRAAQAGSLAGRDSYGLILFQNNKRAEGLPYIEDAAGRGNARAQYILGTALFNGDMIGKDWPRAYAMMTRAVAAGIPAARNSLAAMDKYIPLDQRTRGKALAGAFEAHARTSALVEKAEGAPGGNAGATASEPPKSIVRSKPVAPPKAAVPKATRVAAPKTAPIVAPPGGKWRVQLAALTGGSPANGAKATALWGSLRSRVAALGPYQPYVVSVGPVTRLQAGPLISNAAAKTLCASIIAARQPCIPVAP